MPSTLRICVFLLVASLAAPTRAQNVIRKGKPVPAAIDSSFMIILDTVVTEQWPVTLPAVNPPSDLKTLNPGQCIRVAVLSTGDDNRRLLDDVALGWTVQFGGKSQDLPSAPLTASKEIKPEGSDFVNSALKAGGVAGDPLAAFASSHTHIAASAGKWCVPQGATDQQLKIEAKFSRGDKETTTLKSRDILIESIATGAGKIFKDDKELGEFVEKYHLAPEPARLLPALQFVLDAKAQQANILEFFVAAFQHDAATAAGFGSWFSSAPNSTQVIGLGLLSKAGVQLNHPPTISEDQRKAIAALPDLPSGYDLKADSEIGMRQDLLWGEFNATGSFRSVKTMVSMLAWRNDYDAFDAMRKANKIPAQPTESMFRGVAYSAAGWSIGSFQRSDPLAADYLDAIAADPATTPQIKDVLSRLDTDLAFRRQ